MRREGGGTGTFILKFMITAFIESTDEPICMVANVADEWCYKNEEAAFHCYLESCNWVWEGTFRDLLISRTRKQMEIWWNLTKFHSWISKKQNPRKSRCWRCLSIHKQLKRITSRPLERNWTRTFMLGRWSDQMLNGPKFHSSPMVK